MVGTDIIGGGRHLVLVHGPLREASSSRGRGVLKWSHFSGPPYGGGGLFGKKGGKIKFFPSADLKKLQNSQNFGVVYQ